MAVKHSTLLKMLIVVALIAQSCTVYLPDISNMNRLDTIESHKQQQHEHNINQLNATTMLTRQRHHKSYDKNDDVVVVDVNDEDELVGQLKVVQQAAQLSLSEKPQTQAQAQAHAENQQQQQQQYDINFAQQEEEQQQQHSRQRRQLSDWLIAPNTRWCGRGNTANGTYNHLGGASSADKCCRKHDHCQLYITGMSNRYELFNYRPYTLSHCNCDRRFRTCLKMANDEDAKTIGKLFFNMVQTQCFILRSEKVCQERDADGTCAREYIKQKAYLRNNKKF